MAGKNIYEVFNDFKSAKNKKDRIDVLRRNKSYALTNVLIGAFDKRIEFAIPVPEYKSEDVPVGMSYNHMTHAMDKVYLFVKNNPRVAANLTAERKTQLLTQLLESLEPREAEVFVNMMKKDLKVPHLTEALVNEAFEGLLSKP